MNRKTVLIKAETFKVEEREDGGIRISGLALPFGKRSRNGIIYNKESCIETVEQWKGLPILFNHDENKPIGHVVDVEARDDGLYYIGDLDPAEEDIVRKIRRGDIRYVSIQAIVDRAKEDMEGDVVVKEWLELSVCTIPGFPETSIEIEKFIKEDATKEYDARYQNPDGTFKKMSCPDNPDEESKFCGCVRYMMSKKGLSLDSAKKLCAYIKMKKGQSFSPEDLTDEEIAEILQNEDKNINEEPIYNMMEMNEIMEELKKLREEIQDMKTREQDDASPEPADDVMKLIDELKAEIEAIKARLDALEKAEEEPTEEQEQGAGMQEKKETITREKLIEKLREVS